MNDPNTVLPPNVRLPCASFFASEALRMRLCSSSMPRPSMRRAVVSEVRTVIRRDARSSTRTFSKALRRSAMLCLQNRSLYVLGVVWMARMLQHILRFPLTTRRVSRYGFTLMPSMSIPRAAMYSFSRYILARVTGYRR